ncbi:DUF262 domain-containing protein [Streptomyces sp. NPDC048641]|uniref:DUF262 domain-containing protein n=1 Tax=Streptomyces sp. NPDC048641 TaxID=3154825 RepID=UPI00343C9C6F
MAATLYRDTGYVLSHLIEEIKHGSVALPDIQRPFVWSTAKIRDLFDSMYRGYPVGTLMFWETGAEVGTRQIGGRDNDRVPRLLVVDGQQRLTSLFAVLTGEQVITKTFEKRRIRLAFRPADETFEVTDAAIEKDPEDVPPTRTRHRSFGARMRWPQRQADGEKASIVPRRDDLCEPTPYQALSTHADLPALRNLEGNFAVA